MHSQYTRTFYGIISDVRYSALWCTVRLVFVTKKNLTNIYFKIIYLLEDNVLLAYFRDRKRRLNTENRLLVGMSQDSSLEWKSDLLQP